MMPQKTISKVKAGVGRKETATTPAGFASALVMSMTALLIPPIVSARGPGGTVVAARMASFGATSRALAR